MEAHRGGAALIIFPGLFLLGLVCGIAGRRGLEQAIQALDRRVRNLTLEVVRHAEEFGQASWQN